MPKKQGNSSFLKGNNKYLQMDTPHHILTLITGHDVLPEFAKPLSQAFETIFAERASQESYASAGITGVLFLSAVLKGFPTAKLHTFVRNVREEVPFFSFDCKSYDKLYSIVGEGEMLLLDSTMNYQKTFVTKNDLFEAFDFITNI